MYDWEIEDLLKMTNYTLDSDTYLYICKNSPQIKKVKFIPETLEFEIFTDKNHWKIKVYLANKKHKKVK